MNLVIFIVFRMHKFSRLNASDPRSESLIEIPVLLPELGVNIKSCVLKNMLNKYPKRAAILCFVDLTGSALIVPAVANLFKDITFVVILTNGKCNGIENYRKNAPSNMEILTMDVYNGNARLRIGKVCKIVAPYNFNRIKFRDIDEIAMKAVNLLDYGDYHFFGAGVNNCLFFSEMIFHFRSVFSGVDFSNINRIMIVGGTANTCEAMCYALRNTNFSGDVIVTEVGANFNQKRFAFRNNVKFYWRELGYTNAFGPEVLDSVPEIQHIVESLIKLNAEFACDPYCGKLFLGYELLAKKGCNDLVAAATETLHVFIRNGI